MANLEQANGARKKALDLLLDLNDVNNEMIRAKEEFDAAQHRREAILESLKDLVNRCMPSLGSDDGK